MGERQILVVDDDITSLDLISFVFESRGFKVERCADGVRAIEYLKGATPELILLDLMMPSLSGVDTVARLRQLESGANVPVVAFTAVDDGELHQAALNAGCDEVLTKPCNIDKLLRCISRYLDKVSAYPQ